jgi:catechol 2,3-dioxygenase-like lactoylglutathione lyase family enzyme
MTAPVGASRAFSHVCMCVSDIALSTRFYSEALGFRVAEAYTFENEPKALMEITGELKFRSQFLRLDGMRLELFCFDAPPTINPGPRRPMHTLGFTHLAVRVGDLDEAGAKVEALGGKVLAHTLTRVAMPGYECRMIYCVDPDGQRIELLWMPPEIQLS